MTTAAALGLSPREWQIAHLAAEGLTNREIGAELFLAEKTVKNYVSSLLSKLGFQRRTQAAVFISRPGPPPPSGSAVS